MSARPIPPISASTRTVGWHHRNLFGNAEQLNLTAGIQLGGNAVQKPGYNVGAQFIKPDFLARDQSLEVDLGAIKQSLEAYDQKALTQKIELDRKLSPHWTVGIGISGEQEEITQEGITTRYNLVGLPLSAKYDNTNSLLDPTDGFRGTLLVTPTQSFGGSSATFVIAQLSGSTYFDLSGGGRSVLALRGLVGKAYGAEPVQPAARPALLCRRVGHRARLPLSVGRPAVPRRQADRRHRGQRRLGGVPPAHTRTATAWWHSSMPAR